MAMLVAGEAGKTPGLGLGAAARQTVAEARTHGGEGSGHGGARSERGGKCT